MQHRLAHLLAQAAAAYLQTKPAERVNRAELAEAFADQVLHAHRLVIEDHHEVQPPEVLAYLPAPRPDPAQPRPLPVGTLLVQGVRVVERPWRLVDYPCPHCR